LPEGTNVGVVAAGRGERRKSLRVTVIMDKGNVIVVCAVMCLTLP
jgi:hypothetical protein